MSKKPKRQQEPDQLPPVTAVQVENVIWMLAFRLKDSQVTDDTRRRAMEMFLDVAEGLRPYTEPPPPPTPPEVRPKVVGFAPPPPSWTAADDQQW